MLCRGDVSRERVLAFGLVWFVWVRQMKLSAWKLALHLARQFSKLQLIAVSRRELQKLGHSHPAEQRLKSSVNIPGSKRSRKFARHLSGDGDARRWVQMPHEITRRFLRPGAVKRWGRSYGTHLILSQSLAASWKGSCNINSWRERTQDELRRSLEPGGLTGEGLISVLECWFAPSCWSCANASVEIRIVRNEAQVNDLALLFSSTFFFFSVPHQVVL